jgi:hypothetical protein
MGCCGLITSKKKTSEGHELPARPVNGTAEQKRARELEAQLEAESKKNVDLLQQRGRPLSSLPRSVSLPVPSNLNPSSPAPAPRNPTVEDGLPTSLTQAPFPPPISPSSTVSEPWSLGAVARRTREIEEQNAARAKALQEQKRIDAEARRKELLEANKAERRWVLWDSVEAKEWRANPTKQEEPTEEDLGKEHGPGEESYGYFPTQESFSSNAREGRGARHRTSSWIWPDGEKRSWADIQGLYGLGYFANEEGRRRREEQVGWGDGTVVEEERWSYGYRGMGRARSS